MRGIVVGVLLSAICLRAGDVSGNWSGSFKPNGEDRSHSLYMVFKQDGDKLTGSGGPNESEQHPVQNGKVQGDRLTFEVPAGRGTFSFDLKGTGDEMSGDLQFKAEGETRTAKVSLKRVGT